jgi:hypothetical protein
MLVSANTALASLLISYNVTSEGGLVDALGGLTGGCCWQSEIGTATQATIPG